MSKTHVRISKQQHLLLISAIMALLILVFSCIKVITGNEIAHVEKMNEVKTVLLRSIKKDLPKDEFNAKINTVLPDKLLEKKVPDALAVLAFLLIPAAVLASAFFILLFIISKTYEEDAELMIQQKDYTLPK